MQLCSEIETRAAFLLRAIGRIFVLFLIASSVARAEDGYRLWLRYEPIGTSSTAAAYQAQLRAVRVAGLANVDAPGPVSVAREELKAGLRQMLGGELASAAPGAIDRTVVLALTHDPEIARYVTDAEKQKLGEEGYVLRAIRDGDRSGLLIAANREIGVLYGVFALLRHVQQQRPIEPLDTLSAPRIQRRLLNHWDNLDRSVERGYAGPSIWEWAALPENVTPRYRDYARANASLGINGAVLNNVNSDARILTDSYLRKVAAIADVLRPYGQRVYLTARFSAPVEIGGLATADPLDAGVQAWWRQKAAEIYAAMPDFGGFLLKANSEGQPGPQTYGRTHIDGANMLADVLGRHGGIVMWRAFVYENSVQQDRARQAYNEFVPLDGKFRENAVVQVKNGPIDFMPREPFHPMFGAMPQTTVAAELQITQEYLGHAIDAAFLAPMWKECLDADTHRPRAGATVARVVDGSATGRPLSVIAGVSNVGSDRNWTGHPLAAANWYAFGRLAWDPDLKPAELADEWTRATFSNDPAVVRAVTAILLKSYEAVVSYSMPLGLHHIMAEGHHYGPGPWVDSGYGMTSSVYFHKASATGIGFDRTRTGSDAVSQYAAPVATRWADPATCPDEFLLWFHHLPWDHRMRSGRTLWDELCLKYQAGVEEVRAFRQQWKSIEGRIDAERYAHVAGLLERQERNARNWRDGCLLYFQTFSQRPLPQGVEAPQHPLSHYMALQP